MLKIKDNVDLKEFVKSGFAIKNICKKCQNEKQKKIYSDSKKVRLLEAQLKQKESLIKKIENIFDDTNNSFSDGCDCRKIEKLLDNKGE